MNNRLRAELQRLYGTAQDGADNTPGASQAPAPRALVLELVRPAGWDELASVWRAVQVELDLPAPAIAVSGQAAYQLWFSLAEPMAGGRGAAFLEALCRRYLAGVAPERIRMFPSQDGVHLLPSLPPARVADERWSAFVTPDLAPVFADEPWLDRPPGDEAQADLLSRFEPIGPEAFARAWTLLAPTPSLQPPARPARAAQPVPTDDPRRFLLEVMNDPAVELQWRIEAAKALLPYAGREGSDG